MTAEVPSVFRPAAVRRYRDGNDRAVLPRHLSGPFFGYLWVLLGLLAAGALAAGSVRLPLTVAGPATVLAAPPQVVVAFLPPSAAPRLRPGQRVFLVPAPAAAATDPAPPALEAVVAAVEPGVISPAAAQARFALAPAPALAVTRPATVVLGRPAAPPGAVGLPAAAHTGALFEARVEVGARSLLSRLAAGAAGGA